MNKSHQYNQQAEPEQCKSEVNVFNPFMTETVIINKYINLFITVPVMKELMYLFNLYLKILVPCKRKSL